MSQSQCSHLELHLNESFNSLRIQGLTVNVTVGEAYQGLSMSNPDSIEQLKKEIDTQLISGVENNCLELRAANGSALEALSLSVQELVKVEAFEDTKVKVINASGDELVLIAQSGTSSITASGSTNRLRAQANDGATIVLSEFKSKNVSSGASRGGKIIS